MPTALKHLIIATSFIAAFWFATGLHNTFSLLAKVWFK